MSGCNYVVQPLTALHARTHPCSTLVHAGKQTQGGCQPQHRCIMWLVPKLPQHSLHLVPKP